jgi:hypothetical protein
MPFLSTQLCCGPQCAVLYAREKGTGIEVSRKRAMRERREALKTIGDYTREAQVQFNQFIRLRDEIAGLGCISCNTKKPQHMGKGGAWDCGHYLSRGAHPELRFTEDNCARQCKKCNSFGSGMHGDFRKGLIERIGLERITQIEGPPVIKQYRKPELIEIRDHYRQLVKGLLRDRESL